MSHISRIKTKLIEEEYLLKAINDLGYQVEVKSAEKPELVVRGMGLEKAVVDIKLKTKFGNEIGFRKKETSYEMVADWWRVIGVKPATLLNQLTQRYAYHAAIAKLSQQGFSLIEEDMETKGKQKGQIRLLLRRSEIGRAHV